MVERKSFEGTPEADYFHSLPWKWEGFDWAVRKVPEYTKGKLKSVFDLWQVGWHADIRDCKSGQYNIFIDQRQLKRAGIIMEIPETQETTNEAVLFKSDIQDTSSSDRGDSKG